MRQPLLTALGLLLLGPSLLAAAPHEAGRIAHDSPTHHHTPRPWRRLSDAIVRSIWGIKDAQKNLGGSNANVAHGSPGDDLVARYGDDVVLRFKIHTEEEALALAEAADTLFLDVWEFNQDWCDIRVAKDVVPSLLGLLPRSLHESHQPLMQHLDLAQAVFDSYPVNSATQSHDHDRFSPDLTISKHKARGHPFFQDYQPLSVINPWMQLMSSMFTTHVRRISVGTSYEGRDISALRVGVHPTNNDEPTIPRKTVIVTGGSHAREWISTSSVNYLAWSLINSYGKDHTITRLLEAFDFVLVPTLNPDGYIYSWETDRLWRKNRQPTSLRFCRGVDLDRTYPFQWDGNSSRTNPCSESFAGDEPFAGVEAQQFAEWARNETENNNAQIVGFIDLHSYSEQILYPYSYSCMDEPPSIEDLEELALGLAKAIRTTRKGHAYKVTSACEGNVALTSNPKTKKQRKVILPRIESSGGSALDYFYHELRVKYSYQIKLRDTGSYGFLLPKEHIVPTGEETLDAILYFGRFMMGEIGLLENKNEEKTQNEEAEVPTQNVMEDEDAQDEIEEDEVIEL